MAVSDWQETSSPVQYWNEEMTDANYDKRAGSLDLGNALEMATNMSYGLRTKEALRVCRRRYRNDIARLTVQIADPDVMQIKRDVKMTFPDLVGVVGGLNQYLIAQLENVVSN